MSTQQRPAWQDNNFIEWLRDCVELYPRGVMDSKQSASWHKNDILKKLDELSQSGEALQDMSQQRAVGTIEDLELGDLWKVLRAICEGLRKFVNDTTVNEEKAEPYIAAFEDFVEQFAPEVTPGMTFYPAVARKENSGIFKKIVKPEKQLGGEPEVIEGQNENEIGDIELGDDDQFGPDDDLGTEELDEGEIGDIELYDDDDYAIDLSSPDDEPGSSIFDDEPPLLDEDTSSAVILKSGEDDSGISLAELNLPRAADDSGIILPDLKAANTTPTPLLEGLFKEKEFGYKINPQTGKLTAKMPIEELKYANGEAIQALVETRKDMRLEAHGNEGTEKLYLSGTAKGAVEIHSFDKARDQRTIKIGVDILTVFVAPEPVGELEDHYKNILRNAEWHFAITKDGTLAARVKLEGDKDTVYNRASSLITAVQQLMGPVDGKEMSIRMSKEFGTETFRVEGALLQRLLEHNLVPVNGEFRMEKIERDARDPNDPAFKKFREQEATLGELRRNALLERQELGRPGK